jgi:threonylcarbamoyladenosine tRNA methylthiotransferase MtaB
VFPYSERPGTYAVRLPNKNERSVISQRANRLRELSDGRHKNWAERQLGDLKKILILKNGQGLSRDFWPMDLGLQPLSQVNEEVKARVTGLSLDSRGIFDGGLKAEIESI